MWCENPTACLSTMSLHLSRTLDEIGLNSLTVEKRRSTCLAIEQMYTWKDRFNGRNNTSYNFGSQTEGTTTPGLHSDLDFLICNDDFNVIQDLSEVKRDKVNLLMLEENTAPGYCRLQMLMSDKPMAREDWPEDNLTLDDRGRVIVKNTAVHLSEAAFERNGPAVSSSDRHGFMDNDYVFAFKCNTWPAQAKEFTRRLRRNGWPSKHLLQEAVKHGFFLVPVGHKLSATEPLEWRISASMAERCLMFSLTIVHIKCYVLLKMLVKTFVEPRVEKCISSYNCKTALFHCTENTEAGFWRDDNLIQCVLRCLEMLLTWVTDGFCPHFILHEENLFAGKVTIHNKDTIKYIITDLIRRNGHALLQVHLDDLGKKLQTKLNTEPSVMPVLNTPTTMKLVEHFEYTLHAKMTFPIVNILVKRVRKEPLPLIHFVYQQIDLLKHRIKMSDKHERQAIQVLHELLSCLLGSLLASVALSENRKVPPTAFQLFLNETNTIDTASMLKLASVIFCNGDMSEVETILHSVEDNLSRNIDMPICECHDTRSSIEFCHERYAYALEGKKARAKLFTHCVVFSPQEIYCAPLALRTELHRSVGDDVFHREPDEDRWMDLAAVDCLPYLYFLQYLTAKQLGKQDLQSRSLHNLDRCVREERGLNHRETSWNLLGQCYELELKPDAAMACYRTSLEIRERNNAAKWHIAILCYRLIQQI